MDNPLVMDSGKKPSPFPRAGWYTFFASVPLGSSLPALLLLLIHRITQLFKKPEKKIDATTSPRVVTWTNRLFFILLGAMTLSAAFSPYPGMAFLQTAGFALLVYVFVFGSQTLGKYEAFIMEKCLPILAVSSVIACIIALIRSYFQRLDRAINLFCSYNGFGTVLILVGGLTIGYLAWRGGKWRYWIIPYLAVVIPALLATRSRGGWFGFAAMLSCFAALNRKLLIILLIVIILAGVIFLASPSLSDRLISSFSLDQNLARVFIWRSTFHMIQDHPVTGVGAGVFPLIYHKYVLPDAPEKEVSFAHNLFLQVTAEFGLIGLLIFCAILAGTLYMSFRLAGTGHLAYQGMFAAIIGILIHQQVDLPIWGFDIGGAFWMMIGLTIGLYRYKFTRETGV